MVHLVCRSLHVTGKRERRKITWLADKQWGREGEVEKMRRVESAGRGDRVDGERRVCYVESSSDVKALCVLSLHFLSLASCLLPASIRISLTSTLPSHLGPGQDGAKTYEDKNPTAPWFRYLRRRSSTCWQPRWLLSSGSRLQGTAR